MIQRKQSIYLLLVTILMSFLLIRPYAQLSLRDGKTLVFYSLHINKYSTATDFEQYRNTIPLFLVIVLAGAISFINIFCYNRRILQIRLCVISGILLTAILIIMFIYYSSARSTLEDLRHTFRMAGVFPIIGIVMIFLAYRAIHHDELLVNSYNRIR